MRSFQVSTTFTAVAARKEPTPLPRLLKWRPRLHASRPRLLRSRPGSTDIRMHWQRSSLGAIVPLVGPVGDT